MKDLKQIWKSCSNIHLWDEVKMPFERGKWLVTDLFEPSERGGNGKGLIMIVKKGKSQILFSLVNEEGDLTIQGQNLITINKQKQ